MAQFSLGWVKRLHILPIYKNGILVSFRIKGFGTVYFRWINKEALDYLLNIHPKEIHPDGVK